MTDPLSLETYDYHLPEELIAQFPLERRDSSRLMRVVRSSGVLEHLHFGDIVDLLHEGEVLVLNNSKVIPARLFGTKENGTRVEILLLNELGPNVWKCMVSPGKRLRISQWLVFSDALKGWISLPDEDGLREISFVCETDLWFELDRVGHVPLPPYIRREDEARDRDTYQTVYADQRGSVAAPTAGLHFTDAILHKLAAKGVSIAKITLHVGMGTFLPVKSNRIDEHKMHSEFCTIGPDVADLINTAKQNGRRVIAVGSTSTRSLESFWDGSKLRSGSKWTDIFIYPGRTMNVADAMITNFHLPKSSLLMMISAFAGIELVKKAYGVAVEERYRFFSYGDAMYIE